MYGTYINMCPVTSFEKYVKKCNAKCDAFFQHTKPTFLDTDTERFDNKPIGKNTFGNFIVNLSNYVELSEIYTNHSIRATTITVLNRYGFNDRDIISVSGHRSTNSLSSYVADTSAEVKQSISDTLSSVTNLQAIPTGTRCSNQLPSLDLNLKTVDFLEIDDIALCDILRDIENETPTVNVVSEVKIRKSQCPIITMSENFNFNNCVVTINSHLFMVLTYI